MCRTVWIVTGKAAALFHNRGVGNIHVHGFIRSHVTVSTHLVSGRNQLHDIGGSMGIVTAGASVHLQCRMRRTRSVREILVHMTLRTQLRLNFGKQRDIG